jgi:16S rRNA A1518/A1519 N6-dimethyltransferase RsmA/KsgA/DIM1 with predicted DNA glycosylase/AP lyase activity
MHHLASAMYSPLCLLQVACPPQAVAMSTGPHIVVASGPFSVSSVILQRLLQRSFNFAECSCAQHFAYVLALVYSNPQFLRQSITSSWQSNVLCLHIGFGGGGCRGTYGVQQKT